MVENVMTNAAYWRDRAARTRAKAELFRYQNSRANLLKIAEEYDRLANYAEQQLLRAPTLRLSGQSP
ncbi:hypothetical protein [Bradyrhizobium elkanii]|uniref:Uncharacterized protein n=1 Tax=Bradyrhizobium elkanii TaxID=29448 RepID=A0A7Y8QXT3_BRAEL|nr:hypothetical protein [Bradyrhizobium elkanii]MBP1296322.1 hypothetical protein [Bradyrhizobium elkanii]MCP1749671.1 hypothetical protein [Bradyrhizobium elkanii]MCP1984242.1 hypothetical protein [Bradyrhizobium elkanii]MCS3890036.1 hypothetical protein [Bradyrhizobium elkanii]MCS4210942.1 hypothetical protein [Bradyrhizobium elkanii]